MFWDKFQCLSMSFSIFDNFFNVHFDYFGHKFFLNLKIFRCFHIEHQKILQSILTQNCPNMTFALERFQRVSKHFLTMFIALITSSRIFFSSADFFVCSNLNKKFTIAVPFPSSLLFNSFANVKAIALNTEQVRIMERVRRCKGTSFKYKKIRLKWNSFILVAFFSRR